jgi:glycosyltransferase involved in cell wall biosynthesis
MKEKTLKISVITPSFNSGKYIERAIKSVLEQDYKNFEHVVIDGGSTDGTVDILKKYKHIIWVSEPDGGQTDAMNKGFKRSGGDIIVYLNADDYFFSGAFTAVIQEFKKGADFVVGDVLVKSSRQRATFTNLPRTTLEGMLRHWEPNAFSHNPVGYFYTRRVQESCPFNPDNYAGQDLEFLLDAASKFKFTKINKTLGCFEDTVQTKTGVTQSKLDYWRPSMFPYLNKHLAKFSVKQKIEYCDARRAGYAEVQAQMNRLNRNRSKNVPVEDLPLISVIIPTYNCSAYICRAVDSVLSQGLVHLEVIVVDDASKDDTQEVLKIYRGNSQVCVFRREKDVLPGGSRNFGLDIAKGKYVFFLDADDWLEKGALIDLVSIAETYGLEIVACGAQKTWENGRNEPYFSFALSFDDAHEALYHFADYRIGSIVWGKLYLRSFIEENSLRFNTCYFHEDVMFTLKAIYACEKYISIGDMYYNYFQRSSSMAVAKVTPLHLRSYINLYMEMVAFIKHIDLCKDEDGRDLCNRLLRAHCSSDIFPRILDYVRTCSPEEWEWQCRSACYDMLGVEGYAVADFIVRAMRNNRGHQLIEGKSTGVFHLKIFAKKHFSRVLHSRFRRPLMKMYYSLRLDRFE